MKFLVVDDHALVREGLRHTLELLANDVTVFGAANANDAYALADQYIDDLSLVLLDLNLPGIDGHAVMRELHRRHANLPVAILSASDDTVGVVSALKMGAVGFIPKSSTHEMTLQALRLILSGGVYIPPQALGLAGLDISGAASASAVKPALTARQTEVLCLIALGKPNKIIADELKITEATVKTHVTDIMRALKVTNRAQAGVAARRLGFG